MHANPKPFVVAFCTQVDRPDLRGDTFPVVPKGHLIPTKFAFATQGAAVNYAKALMERGECDFSSEYVISVQVLRMREGRSPRVVRVRHCRYSRNTSWERRD